MSESLFKDPPFFKKAALIGTGLIGGSIGLSLRLNSLVEHCACYDRDDSASHEAVRIGAADRAAGSALEAVDDADLVILAVPVLSTSSLFKEIFPALKQGALVTDVGSTKASIMAAVEPMLEGRLDYIGGHPMAGSEETGIEGADPALLENAIYVLSPAAGTSPEALARLTALVEAAGAQPLILDPLAHDRIVALVSHLPHVIAATLSRSVAKAGEEELVRTLAAGGFRDSTRIALGSPEVWRDICVSNRWPILSALKNFRASLDELEKLLGTPDGEAIREYLLQARDFRSSVPHRGRGILPELHEMIVLIKDSPGAIGKVAGLLGDAGINIDSIEILHVRELAGGSIRFGFKDRDQCQEALRLLGERGYQAHGL